MKKFNLIDIDESKLPNVNLSYEQKNSIKRKMKLNLQRFIEGNSSLNIDTSDENILKIEEKLGDKKNKTLHSIKYANVLKEIVLEAIESDCPFNKNELVGKYFLHSGAGTEFENIPSTWITAPFYYQLYITRDTLLIYTLDHYFRLTKKRIIPIKDITSVAVTDKDMDGTKLSHKNLLINIKSATNPGLYCYPLVDLDPKDSTNLEKIKNLLISFGVNELKPKKIPLGLLVYIIFYSFMILMFIMLINNFLR